MIKNRPKDPPFLIQPPVYFVTTPTGSFVTEDKDGNDCLFVFTDEDSTRPFLERARQLPDLAGVPFSTFAGRSADQRRPSSPLDLYRRIPGKVFCR